ncbi:hypothetical protein A2U01_0055689, partial [Trifolium medium]|nr:hypothetical protein [Trifolium medium]
MAKAVGTAVRFSSSLGAGASMAIYASLVDAVFGYMSVAPVVTTVFAFVHVRLYGQLLGESNAFFFEVGARDLGQNSLSWSIQR